MSADLRSDAEGARAARCAEVLVMRAARLADRPLTYRIPPALRAVAATGMRVLVPLGSRRVLGLIVDTGPCGGTQAVRDVVDIPDDAPLFSARLLVLARAVAADTLASLLDAVRCLVPPEVLRRRPPARPQIATIEPARRVPPRVGRRQAAVLAALSASSAGVSAETLARGGGRAALTRLVDAGIVRMHDAPRALRAAPGGDRDRDTTPSNGGAAAVASSGRSVHAGRPAILIGDPDARAAWIAEAAAAAVHAGGQGLIIVPEIADVSRFADLVERAAGGRIVAFHSDLPAAGRRTAWARIRDGDADIVVGSRSAVFAPLGRLRLIVVDEEHAPGHKSDAAPRYHARDVAVLRARLERAALVLGAGAPSVETYAAVAAGDAVCVRLPPPAPAPVVTVVDMLAEQRRGHVGYVSRALVQAMARHLRARGTIALLAQRGGYARVLLCRECGAAVRCPACDLAVAYERDGGTVRCRVCGRSGPAPDVCPRCRGVGLHGVGAGTKRIEEIVRRLFPAVRTARLDAETAPAAARVIRAAAEGRLSVIIGTAVMLRAGGVRPSLVGVIDGDGPLYLPDFRAAERALQRLRAAASLAAASARPLPASVAPEVVVQTRVPDHPVLRALATGDDAGFYQEELRLRREFGYPPYTSLVRLVAEAASLPPAAGLADRAAAAARARGLDVLGPAPLRAAGRARVQCVLRSARRTDVRDGTRAVLGAVTVPAGARLWADVDPQEMV